jgi:hypothetical protein
MLRSELSTERDCGLNTRLRFASWFNLLTFENCSVIEENNKGESGEDNGGRRNDSRARATRPPFRIANRSEAKSVIYDAGAQPEQPAKCGGEIITADSVRAPETLPRSPT